MPRRLDPNGPLSSQDDFFIPELCEWDALLTLVMLVELFVLIIQLVEPSEYGFNWYRLLLVSLFVQGIVLVSATTLCWLRPVLQRLSTRWASVLCSAIVISVTLLATALANHWQLNDFPQSRRHHGSLYLQHALIALIMSTLLLRYFYLRSQWRRQREAELWARIESLQARIRPHFLFNSLNSIASLIGVDPQKAEQSVMDLSDLFRASLAKPGVLVAWKEELALATRYLAIEQNRLGDRLQLEWNIDNVPEDLPIPLLSLQPLLENALIYGIQPRVDGGLVRVEASCRDGLFELCVSNPYEEEPSAVPTGGLKQALLNIEARLEALFGSKASLNVERRDGRHFTRLRYPCARLMQEV